RPAAFVISGSFRQPPLANMAFASRRLIRASGGGSGSSSFIYSTSGGSGSDGSTKSPAPVTGNGTPTGPGGSGCGTATPSTSGFNGTTGPSPSRGLDVELPGNSNVAVCQMATPRAVAKLKTMGEMIVSPVVMNTTAGVGRSGFAILAAGELAATSISPVIWY